MAVGSLMMKINHLQRLSQWFGRSRRRRILRAGHHQTWVPSRDDHICPLLVSLAVRWSLRSRQTSHRISLPLWSTPHTPYYYTWCDHSWPASSYQQSRFVLSWGWISQLNLEISSCYIRQLLGFLITTVRVMIWCGNQSSYLCHYKSQCCTVSPDVDPPDSLSPPGPGPDCHRVSAWSQFLHHSSVNTQTSQPRNPRNH